MQLERDGFYLRDLDLEHCIYDLTRMCKNSHPFIKNWNEIKPWSGVYYFFVSNTEQLLYIGSAKNIKSRLQGHNRLNAVRELKGDRLGVYYFKEQLWDWQTPTEDCTKKQRKELEQHWIYKYKPALNCQSRKTKPTHVETKILLPVGLHRLLTDMVEVNRGCDANLYPEVTISSIVVDALVKAGYSNATFKDNDC